MLYYILSFFELLGEIKNNNILILYTKPFLMPTLYFEVLYYNYNIHYPIIISVLFSTLGDYFLLWRSNIKYFLLGIFCFMGTQISYSYYFYHNSLIKCDLLSFSIVLTITQLILLQILDNITNNILKVIVALYTYMVGFMFYSAIIYHNYLVLLGCSLFVTSDILLGVNINNIYKYQNIYNVLIMLTYLSGQYLILHNI